MTSEKDPLRHCENVKGMLDDVIQHLRNDIQVLDEPKVQAMFETAAEVLTGLRTAVDHYEQNAEAGMQRT